MKSPQIFISYSSQDRKIVEEIHEILSSLNNFSLWRDQTRLRKDWSKEIADALVESDVLCFMWSESAAASKWVKHEWLTARALEKRIISILFPDAPKLPEPLHNIHGIHLIKSDPQAACQEVIDRLRDCESFTEPYDYKILPANSYIPFNPNSEFTGRHIDLIELYLKMIGNLNKIGINQVGTIGMGGVGKTQLAVEFAYRFSFAFDNVFWIQAADVYQWRSELVELARDRLGLSISDPDNPQADKRYIFRLQKYCKDNPQTLIIMDNVIEPRLLNSDTHLDGLTPLTLGCNLLFTTRQHFRLNGVTAQPVDVLSPESAYMLLTHNRKPISSEEEEHARAICNAVGFLPLAIVLIEGYLYKFNDLSFADYHSELCKNKLGAIDSNEISEEELATRHKASVGFTLKQDWKRITDKNARLLFRLAGQFDESAIIPKARLGLLAGIASGKSKLHIPLDKSFNLLHELSLVEKMGSDSRAIRPHPLVRDFALMTVPENKQIKFRSNAAENLRSAYFDYPHLESEINTRGVAEVIDDLQIAINWWVKEPQVLHELQLLHSALRLSDYQLTQDPRQLAPHLVGRLEDVHTSGISKLLRDATENKSGVWFNPLSRSLTSPGGSLFRTFEGHSDPVMALAISPDGKIAVSGSSGGTLKMWDLSNGSALYTLKSHSDRVTAVAMSPDGKTAVYGSDDFTFDRWDLSNSKSLRTLLHHIGFVKAVAISPDGQTVISGSSEGELNLLDLSSGKVLRTLEGHRGQVNAVVISANGQTVISGLSDGTLNVLDFSSGKVLRTLEGHSDRVNAVAMSPDGKTAISGSWDKTLKLWDLSCSKTTLYIQEGQSGPIMAMAISPDKQTAVSGSPDGTLKLWDLTSGRVLHALEGHSVLDSAVLISTDGQTAVSGSFDGTLKLWDLSTGKALHTLEGHSKSVTALAISADGKTAVSGSGDKTIKLWDLSSGNVLCTLEGHSDKVNAVAISPDGQTVASGSSDKTFKLWDISNSKAIRTLWDHSGRGLVIAISPDEQTVVSGSSDGTLKLWDLSRGKAALNIFKGHSDRVNAVAISPDGRTAVSGSSDNTVKLWDLSNGNVVTSFIGESDIYFLAMSSCGSVVFAGEKNGHYHLLRIIVTDKKVAYHTERDNIIVSKENELTKKLRY